MPRKPRLPKPKPIVIDRFHENFVPVTETGCWLWTASWNAAGYGQFALGGRPHLAHRMSLTLQGINVPEGMLVCHKCDTPACVNPDHLFIGTSRDNTLDMLRKNRANRFPRLEGQSHGMAKISNETAMAVYREPGLYDDVAAKFGVGWGTVQAIKSGRQWASVTGAVPGPVKKYNLKPKEIVSSRPLS